MLKGGMAVCLIANRRDGLSMKIVLKVGLLGFACNFSLYTALNRMYAVFFYINNL